MLSAVVLGSGNEPFVAVDPFNPLNVVVGGNGLGAVFSTDGAETFSAASVPAGYRGDPGLAIDSDGNIFFSYLIDDSVVPLTSLDIAVSATTFAAQDFTANQIAISNGTEFDNKALIATDYFTTSPFRDNIYVAWREVTPDGLRYSRSTDGGTTFSPSQVLTTPAHVFLSGADPEVGPSGEVYIMYWDGSNIGGDVGEIRLLKSTDGGETFVNPVAGGGGISAAPGVVGFDATGLDHDGALMRNQAPNQSFRWDVRTMIDIEADPLRSGNVYAVWLTDPDGTTTGDAANVVFSRSVDAGVHWSTPSVLNDDGGTLTQHMPTIAVDEAGNLVTIWYDERLSPDGNDPDLAIFGSASLDGGATWSPNFLLEDSMFDPDSGGANTFIGDYIKVAAADGTAFAAWTQTDNGTNEIRIEKFSVLAAFADRFEPNNSQANATVLGSLTEITLEDLTIHDEDDQDWFKITANSTGSLVINAFFDDDIGDIDITVWDENGNIISSSGSASDDEQIVMPVVSQESYFLRVVGFGSDKNHYDLEIENFAAPIPEMPVLHPDDDNGISDEDNITDVTDPVVIVQADLAGFDQMGILILSAAQAAAGMTPGAAVEVFINGESQGFADAVGSSSTLFDFELSSLVLQNGLPITGGTLNFVTAAVRIFDGQRDDMGAASPATGRTQLSESLRLRYQDVLGPRVKNVTVTGDSGYDLFLPKPTAGPTPLIESLTVEFTPTYDVDNNVDADYEDIGGTGTQIVFATSDNSSREIPVGFEFPFFDGIYYDVHVSTNGMLTFGSGFAGATNLDLTDTTNPPIQPVIAPLWDDWDTDPVFSDGVYYETLGTPGVDLRLIVQWRDIEHFNADGVGVGPTVDFEAVLFEDGTIEFRYNDVLTGDANEDNGISATVGIRKGLVLFGGGRDVHQVSFDEPAIFDGRAIRFTPPFDPDIVTYVGHYSLVGDATGHALIESATFLAPNKVRLDFAEPLPDDRFTFTISDSLTDLTGNALDGESQVAAPGGYVLLPSGDGVPGGDFVARFTVDTRPEIGVWAAGTTLIDINGNFSFDPDNVDAVNRDLAFHLGFSSDSIFAGNFVDTLAGPGAKADGFDKLAIYGRVGNGWRWLIDTDNNGVPDLLTVETASGINGLPVAGNFDGNTTNGDEIGVFDGRRWYFDVDRSFTLQNNVGINARYGGFPIVGDFDGDGDDDLGTYVASLTGGNVFSIDLNVAGPGAPIVIDGNADFVFRVGIAGLGAGSGFFGFPGVRERPVAADMNADGVDDIGLWVPDGSALVPGNQGEWYFFISGDNPATDEVEQSVFDRIDDGFIPFTPVPFGDDIYARFGNSFAVPIVGNFDPPLPGGSGSSAAVDGTATSLPTTVTATEPPPGPVGDEDVPVVTSEGSPVAFDAVTSAAYVESLYRDLLDRDSDAAGTAAWLDELRDGMTRREVASAFWFSTERMQRVVDHYYRTYLGRAADPNGRAHWTDQMVGGLTEADLAVTFLTSNEFVSRFRDDLAYVDSLYQHVLGRAADRTGRDHWVAQLRGGLARGDFVRAMFASREKQSAIIDAVYEDLLRRDIDPVGLDLYLNLATSEMGKAYDVASMILASDEYFQRIRHG